MALTEDAVLDLIQILDDGQIQVRRAQRVLRDGRVIAREFSREVLDPGLTTAGQVQALEPRLRAIIQAIWTPGVIAARKAALGR